ncbi:MAG: cobyrinate a,c-diamide synthase [Nitrospirae bacterium]|nr:cobyrinate a,c-diamide synthase [Nitrospirota bacterium]
MFSGAFIVAGTNSGVGKTTVSIGLMAALKSRGLAVQPFKVGPDFIDPAYHEYVSGRASRNLDGWMMGSTAVRGVYARASATADVSVIEGVMGLFDGIGKDGLSGSTAQVAKLTGAPVVLVVDARSMAGSAAAVVRGFESLDPDVIVAGVILNRVGSERHERLLKDAVKRHCKAKVIGAIPREDGLDIPSRHLGLTTDVGSILTKKFVKKLRETVEKNVDIDALMRIAGKAARIAPAPMPSRTKPASAARLAVAMDEAFCFYYRDNLEMLESHGIEIVPFSPLKDDGLPPDIRGIYIGGGYPEMYARGLGFNDFVKHDIRAAAEAGIPIYAECGGLMYLTEGITDLEGVFHPMVGVFPVKTKMLDKRKALGYREVVVEASGALFPEGKKARGHEFHYSEIEPMPRGVKRGYKVTKAGEMEGKAEGYMKGNVLASYVHLHFASNRAFAIRFADNIKMVQAPYKRA